VSWDLKQTPTSRMRAPRDGIVASHRPRGWLAEKWLLLLRDFGSKHPNRVARGRSFARGGRVRDLWFSPGLANAEVIESEPHSVSVRVRVFDTKEWKRALKILQGDLTLVASLLEGELPQTLLERLESAGLSLFPNVSELDGDCDCGDYALPCGHMAAVFTVLADALDGEPFLLLTLRGRTRAQILSALRRVWGDDKPMLTSGVVPDEAPPEASWFTSPISISQMEFHPLTKSAASGLLELGPAPGDADVGRALGPLYEGGANAARELALREGPIENSRRGAWRRHNRSSALAALASEDPVMEVRAMVKPKFETRMREGEVRPSVPGITELLVDLLATLESAKSKELAMRLEVPMVDVRSELLELEKLGIVYRTGQTRGTRWWLG
jgi:uncharacterized Zn finger protein